ncbi:hypothetical protein AOLI_G00320790 [Acnodon oligacanthus]
MKCGLNCLFFQREPLIGEPESARRSRPPSNGSVQRSGNVVARHVGIPDVDQRFADVVEMFNKQQEHYECMEEKRKTLMYRYRCSVDDSLSDCLKKMKDEHGEAQALGELRKDEPLPPDGSSSSQAGNQGLNQ